MYNYDALGRFMVDMTALRGTQGISVKDALQIFNAAMDSLAPNHVTSHNRVIPKEVSDTFDPEKKIHAIKDLRAYRKKMGEVTPSLKDAKDDVDEYFSVTFGR